MKTIMDYLIEQEQMAAHNLLCYSANYLMTKPKVGCEKQFEEAHRDCEIVDELIVLATHILENNEVVVTAQPFAPIITHTITIEY